MNATRSSVLMALCLLLAVTIAACSKRNQDQLATNDTDTTLVENPATTDEMSTTQPPASSVPPQSDTKTTTPAAPASARTVSLPAGAVFDVVMTTSISTKTSNVGDKVEAKLKSALSSPDLGGRVIAEQGASVYGTIAELRRASHSKSEEDRAMVRLEFTSIQTVDGVKTLSSTVTNSEGKMIAGSTTTRDALIIGGSTVAGAVVGKVVGKDTKATIIGAVGGAILGTGAVMAAKGYELEVPAGSTVTLRADAPVVVAAK